MLLKVETMNILERVVKQLQLISGERGGHNVGHVRTAADQVGPGGPGDQLGLLLRPDRVRAHFDDGVLPAGQEPRGALRLLVQRAQFRLEPGALAVQVEAVVPQRRGQCRFRSGRRRRGRTDAGQQHPRPGDLPVAGLNRNAFTSQSLGSRTSDNAQCIKTNLELNMDDSSPLEASFQHAAARVRQLDHGLDSAVMLRLYALYKQSTLGPCTGSRPGLFQFTARTKWDAWNSLGSMTSRQAMADYVQLVNSDQARLGLVRFG